MTTLATQRKQREARETGRPPAYVLDGARSNTKVIYIGKRPYPARWDGQYWRAGGKTSAALGELVEELRGTK